MFGVESRELFEVGTSKSIKKVDLDIERVFFAIEVERCTYSTQPRRRSIERRKRQPLKLRGMLVSPSPVHTLKICLAHHYDFKNKHPHSAVWTRLKWMGA
jgi:hypothetical protein